MSLRTAGLVLGGLHIVLSIVLFVLGINALLYYEANETSLLRSFSRSEIDAEIRAVYSALVYMILWAIASILVVIGTLKKSHLLFLPWLVLGAIFLIVAMPGILLASFYYMFVLPTMALILLAFGVLIGLFLYSYIAIYSLYEELRESKREREEIQVESGYTGSRSKLYK